MNNLRIDVRRSECDKEAFAEMVKENLRMSSWDISDFFVICDVKDKGYCVWIKSKKWDRMQNKLATETFYRDYVRRN